MFDAPAPNGGGLTLPRDSATSFDLASSGFSSALTWGAAETGQTTVGADLRHYTQGLSETQFRPSGGGFRTGTGDVIALLPDSHSTDTGVYGELAVPVNDRLKVKTGGRVDWVSSSAGPGAISRRGGTSTRDVIGPDRDSSFTLWSAYVTGDYELSDSLTATAGLGFAESNVTLFGSVMYVEGRNKTLNQLLFDTPTLPEPPGSNSGSGFGSSAFDKSVGQESLPQIPPLESRLGIRFHDAGPEPIWSTEFTARIVDNQDRVAGSLLERATPGFTTFDFRGHYRPYDDLTIIFGVLNFTDKLYREHLDNRAGNQLYQPGISGYVGSELTY